MISTLPSLRHHTTKDIEGILANLTLDMLPDPGVGKRHRRGDITPEFNERLLQEIRVSLGLKRDDKSSQAIAKIHSYLAREMGRVALQGVDISEVKRRLGERGTLAPSLYRIEFTQQFVRGYEGQGANRADVERTLQAPDRVDHIVPTGLGMQPDKATSLYVKLFPNSSTPLKTFSLLVGCQRVGNIQRVGHAWRIYHSDVDLSRTITAVDVLRAFVDKYGVEITVGEKKDKFFWYERVPVKSDAPSDIVKFNHSKNIDMEVNFQRGLYINGALEIVYAFAINNTVYRADLLTHGIKTKH
jgi:hypothetical protein